MNWLQKEISLSPKKRGFHLVTREILEQVPELSQLKIGIVHIFICHTSASITINENADSDVRADFESYFNKHVPENAPYYTHNNEGPDDMPAHIKASLMGSSISIPVKDGRLNIGIWQGIYLCEHRNRGGARKLIVTIYGQNSSKC